MKEELIKLCKFFSIILLAGFGVSLFPHTGWLADLFSHFAIQYAVGGFVLGWLCLFFRMGSLAIILFLVSVFNIYEIRASYTDPLAFNNPHIDLPPHLTVVHYNKLYRNNQWALFDNWVRLNADNADLVIIQETTPATILKMRSYEKQFPYRYPDKKWNHYNDVSVMSRYPFEARPVRQTQHDGRTVGTFIKLKKPYLSHPVHIYTVHAHVPFGERRYYYQRRALKTLSSAVQNDPHPYILMTGDWNLTPYAPLFHDVLDQTGMIYNDYSYFPKVTWNSTFIFPFFKIPIDHIIHSPAMKQVDKQVGPALGSDHNMLISKFHIPENKASE